MLPALVETRALSKSYRRVAALSDCNLTIHSGEVFGLLGPNGSGKTTLLRLLLGFLRPTRGCAAIAGHDCWHDSVAVHAKVSYLPGDVRLARGARACDVLAFFAHIRGERAPSRGGRIADRLGLDLSRRTGQMSTGMRQKLALTVALSADTPLLVLDEPTSNLDPTVRGAVLTLVREARAAGRTVLFSSHVLSEIEQVCDRVVVLRAGRVAHDQVMSRVRRGHRIRASLTGSLPELPKQLAGQMTVRQPAPNRVMIDAPGSLAPLMGWLAALPLTEIHVEPIGLEAVYEQIHPAEQSAEELGA